MGSLRRSPACSQITWAVVLSFRNVYIPFIIRADGQLWRPLLYSAVINGSRHGPACTAHGVGCQYRPSVSARMSRPNTSTGHSLAVIISRDGLAAEATANENARPDIGWLKTASSISQVIQLFYSFVYDNLTSYTQGGPKATTSEGSYILLINLQNVWINFHDVCAKLFGTLQHRFILNPFVDSIFMKFVIHGGATWQNLTTRISLSTNI